MKISNENVLRPALKSSINHSLTLQQHLKFLSLSINELEIMALELLENNAAVESFEPLIGSFADFPLDSIPQPQMEVFFEQIPTKLLSPQYKILSEEIFSSLDSEGFLSHEEKEYLMKKHGPQTQEILLLMQDYSGLGFEHRLHYWRSLLEKSGKHPECVLLITHYPNELKEGDFPALLKKLNMTFSEFKNTYLKVFKKLPLSPLKPVSHKPVDQKIDAKIELIDEQTNIEVPSPMPVFYLSKQISETQQDVKDFYKPHLEALKIFIEGVKKRKITLEKLLSKIVIIQKPYLQGDLPTPLEIHPEVLAASLDIHPSTLARCLQNKKILCAHGVIELKSLVSPAYLDENKKHLLQKLQSLISNENKQAPYSDEKLLQLLKAKGSKISRRTLTKYRHQLKIPDARRRFFS